MTTKIDTGEKYTALMGGRLEATDFESTVLSAGREFLPQCARDVLDGAEPGPVYWTFLAWQAAVKDLDTARTLEEIERARGCAW